MNIKSLSLVMGTLLVGTSAFAQTYHCDILRNRAGEALLGAPAYSIVIEGMSVTLAVTTGADEGMPLKTTDYRMEKVVQEVEGGVYEVDGAAKDRQAVRVGGSRNIA